VQVITNSTQKVYVALESAESAGQSLASLGVAVRRYSRDGALESEVRNISLDYYVAPTTPFRVANDVLYQLFPTANAIIINVWDLR
jgi:hypothetical protein